MKTQIILLMIFLTFVVLSGCMESNTSDGGNSSDGESQMSYDVYPDTDDAPVLEFIWGTPDLDLSDIYRVTPYGVWEGGDEFWDPAQEMQFYIKNRDHDPVYAGCEGTLIIASNEHGFVSIRYGRNYGIVYHHVVDFPGNLEPGMKIERGALLGYTEEKDGISWWEVEIDVKRGDVFRTVPPIDYFSEESQQKLNDIVNASDIWYDDLWGVDRAWTVTEGDSWIPYLDEPEWWTTAMRIGYNEGDNFESEEDFIIANNMNFMLNN